MQHFIFKNLNNFCRTNIKTIFKIPKPEAIVTGEDDEDDGCDDAAGLTQLCRRSFRSELSHPAALVPLLHLHLHLLLLLLCQEL